MSTLVEDIEQALRNLHGVARLQDIYQEVRRIRTEPLPPSLEHNIRARIEEHSSDSDEFLKRTNPRDLFFSVYGKGEGVWGLREMYPPEPKTPLVDSPNDTETTDAENEVQGVGRSTVVLYRPIRDSHLIRYLKSLHANRCQLCKDTLFLSEILTFSEAHHIRPLGKPHHGPDKADNILVLCPNCHVRCDHAALRLTKEMLFIHPAHAISDVYLTYHNTVIVGKL
jgi:hypothetical protein